MAAQRKLLSDLRKFNSIILSASTFPHLFISRRGIASKLFVGGYGSDEVWDREKHGVCTFGILSYKEGTYYGEALKSVIGVGGISFRTTEEGLSEAFSQYGQIIEAKIVMDRVSDRSKGFGFVTYASEDEAENAIKEMNGKPLNGRAIFVDYAKPGSHFRGGIPIARGPPEPASEN